MTVNLTSDQSLYYVYEDTNNASPTKIHLESCKHYKNHVKRITLTTKWYGPYTFDEAIKLAIRISKIYTTGWKKAECCIKN